MQTFSISLQIQTCLHLASVADRTVIMKYILVNKESTLSCGYLKTVHVYTRVCVSRCVYQPASCTYCCTSWWITDTPDRKLIMSTQQLSDRLTGVTLKWMFLKKRCRKLSCLTWKFMRPRVAISFEKLFISKEHKWVPVSAVPLLLDNRMIIGMMDWFGDDCDDDEK